MYTARAAVALTLCLLLAGLAGAQLSGTYTIDPSGSGAKNYTTFGAATAALGAGVSGPVVFRVAGTTFPEMVTVAPAGGMSVTNTVTFVAPGAPAIIDANGGQDGLTLNGASQYYVFENLEVRNVTRYALNVAGPTPSASFCTFRKCKFDAPASTSTAVRAAHLNYCNDCTFINCVFAGGGYTAYSQQINRCVFQGCEFDGKLLAPYVIAPFNSNDANNLWENCFFHSCGPSGRALYFNWSSYGNNLFHNVILVTSTNEAVFMGSCCGWSRAQCWRNNIFINLGTGPCVTYGYEDTTFGGGPGLDYNDTDSNCFYHPNGPNTVRLETNTQGFAYSGNLAGWQAYFAANRNAPLFVVPGGGSSWDQNSIEADPRLVSITPPYDIHLTGASPCLNAGTTTYVPGAWVTGLPANYVTAIDFEGDARPATLVDIGADEISVSLIGSGSGQIGTVLDYTLFAAADAGLPYQLGNSLGSGPIPIGTRQLGLSVDNLLVTSTAGTLPAIFRNYGGLLDAQGQAAAKLAIPNLPALKGVRIYAAFVTLQASAPFGISNISSTFLFSIQ